MKLFYQKGSVGIPHLIGTAIIVAIITAVANFMIENVFSSPQVQATEINQLSNRVTTLETKQQATDKNALNQSNKNDWVIQSIQAIGSKVGAQLPPLPVNQ